MTKFERYFDGARQYLYDNPHQRRGQAYVNYLYTFDKAALHLAYDSDRDPFNQEHRFEAFLEMLRDRWKGEA